VNCHKLTGNKSPQLNVLFVSQSVVGDRGPSRDHSCRLPWDKTFSLTKKKRETTRPSPQAKRL